MELNKEYEKEYKVKYCIDNKLLCDSYPILSSDGWGNAGELIMSKILEKDATYIIKNYPEIYFKSLVDSFRIFFMTSVEYTEFIYSNMKLPKVIKTLHPLTKYGKREYWFSLTIVMTYIILLTYAVISLFNSRYRMQITAFLTFFSLCFFLVTEKRSFVIFYMLYLLLLIIAYLIGVVTTIFKNRRFDFKYENKVTIICLGIIFYLLVTSNLIEVGENMRFRMGSDVMLLPILLFFLKDVKHYITAMDFNKLFMKIKKCLSG
jgi:hypothetical protein